MGGEDYSGEAITRNSCTVVLIPRDIFLSLMDLSNAFRSFVFTALATPSHCHFMIKELLMFTKNKGNRDRILRVIVGLVLLIAYFMFPDVAYSWALLIGIVPLATGLLGSCPLYSILGLNTCPLKK
ncbi:MAG: hypothetical protein ACI9BH_003493 [Paracoccaceae bacterium]